MFGFVIMSKKDYAAREEILENAMKLNDDILDKWKNTVELNGKVVNDILDKWKNTVELNGKVVKENLELKNALCEIGRDILGHEDRLSRIEKIAACRSGVTVDKFIERED